MDSCLGMRLRCGTLVQRRSLPQVSDMPKDQLPRRTVPAAPSIVPAHSNRLESFLGNADYQKLVLQARYETNIVRTMPGEEDIYPMEVRTGQDWTE